MHAPNVMQLLHDRVILCGLALRLEQEEEHDVGDVRHEELVLHFQEANTGAGGQGATPHTLQHGDDALPQFLHLGLQVLQKRQQLRRLCT